MRHARHDRNPRDYSDELAIGGADEEWTPASTPGLHSWFRADSGITLSAGLVASWTSKVNGYVLSQGTAANQPTYSAGQASLGGQPAVVLDGVNDRLVSTAPAATWKFLHAASRAVYLACTHASDQAGFLYSTSFTISNASVSFAALTATSGTRRIQEYLANGTGTYHINNGVSVPALTVGLGNVVSSRYTLNTNLKLDTSEIAEQTLSLVGSTSNANPAATLAIGYGGAGWGQYFHGPVAEILIYDAAVSDADHAKITAYLAAQYGI